MSGSAVTESSQWATSTSPRSRVVDATGLIVAPGFVDPHTHYDAQLLWDPTASPSSVHGVTTVIGGNCGFTLAPLRPGDDDYLRRMMAKVEGMPLAALEHGTDWSWESFAEYLDRLDGNVSVNAGFLVGHCAIRRYVMGGEAVGNAANADEIDAMRRELATAFAAGAIGFSFTNSTSHSDGEGEPVASRWATPDELLALCEETGLHEGTTLEGIVPGCLDRFADDEIELLARDERGGQPTDELERAHRRQPRTRPGAAAGAGLRPFRRSRWQGRRADDAGAGADEHEPAQRSAGCG